MGTDIYGWIECKTHVSTTSSWQAVKELTEVYLGRSYAAFGCLFGVRNVLDFEPIAADRGLPNDVSPEVATDAGYFTNGNLCCHTWITWADVQRIDWEETSKRVEQALHMYRRAPNGELRYKYLDVEGAADLSLSQRDDTVEQEWMLGDIVYRTKKVPRKVILPDWQATFDFLAGQAYLSGDTNVRWVVWFD